MDFDVPDMQNHLILSMSQFFDTHVSADSDEEDARIATIQELLESDEYIEGIADIKGKLAEACEMLHTYLNKEST